jgi:hypothetical protein
MLHPDDVQQAAQTPRVSMHARRNAGVMTTRTVDAVFPRRFEFVPWWPKYTGSRSRTSVVIANRETRYHNTGPKI